MENVIDYSLSNKTSIIKIGVKTLLGFFPLPTVNMHSTLSIVYKNNNINNNKKTKKQKRGLVERWTIEIMSLCLRNKLN